MKIIVNKWTTVGSIQLAFNTFFPAFKLEFFLCKYNQESLFPDNEKLKPEYVISSDDKNILSRDIEIDSANKVRDIEKMFYEKYGLCAQIFFKCKNKWIQTVKSDHYSLKRLEWELGFSRHFVLL
jgi:hypothetical protein